MLETPKSLTATIYVRFHYKEPAAQGADRGKTETIARILDHASEMTPNLQEILIQFAAALSEQSQKGAG